MSRGGGTKEKRVSVSQRAQTKKDHFRDRSLLRVYGEPHYLNCFSALRQGLLCSSGAEHRVWLWVQSGQRETPSQPGEWLL